MASNEGTTTKPLSIEAPADSVSLKINGRYWDPSITYARHSANTNYITVTTFQGLSPEEHNKLQDLGVEIQELVDSNTYLCRYAPSDLQQIRALSFVRQADVYRSKFKVVADLKNAVLLGGGDEVNDMGNMSSLASAEISHTISLQAAIPQMENQEQACTVDLIVHPGISTAELIEELAEKGEVSSEEIQYSSRKLRMTVQRHRVKTLATCDGIQAITEVVPKVINDDHAREILSANVVINQTPFLGAGETIVVSDTGFDTGSIEGRHPAFNGCDVKLVPVCRPGESNDPNGHGTHVSGCIIGQTSKSSQYKDATVGGVAPKANLVVQSLYVNQHQAIGDVLDLTDDLFGPPYYNHKAVIHNNSWGEAWSGQRAWALNNAGEVDDFVWQNKDAVILFSAGNDNERAKGQPAVGAHAAAKNCITVGATGLRSINGKGVGPEQMLSISSRGPTKEGRIKPDVVAPGGNIISTVSQEKSLQARRKPADDLFLRNHGIKPDTLFEPKNGTSMATPLVAGCVAVLREAIKTLHNINPSAALVKALIINGAVPQSGVPMDAQGFGRVNVKNSVHMVQAPLDKGTLATHTGFLEGDALKQGETMDISVTLPNPEELASVTASTSQGTTDPVGTFKITLVYTDPPGAMLQNSLNLTVLAPDGSSRNGNGLEGNTYDEVNNVEQVEWALPPGEVKATVRATRIAKPDQSQPFALAWSWTEIGV